MEFSINKTPTGNFSQKKCNFFDIFIATIKLNFV